MHSGQPVQDVLKEADRKTLMTKYNVLGCIDTQLLPDPADGINTFALRPSRGCAPC